MYEFRISNRINHYKPLILLHTATLFLMFWFFEDIKVYSDAVILMIVLITLHKEHISLYNRYRYQSLLFRVLPMSVRKVMIYENMYYVFFVVILGTLYNGLYHSIFLSHVSTMHELYIYGLSVLPYLVVFGSVLLIFRYVSPSGSTCVPEFILSGVYIGILMIASIPYMLYSIYGNTQTIIISICFGVLLLGMFMLYFPRLYLMISRYYDEQL
jgi:hypothetical protein